MRLTLTPLALILACSGCTNPDSDTGGADDTGTPSTAVPRTCFGFSDTPDTWTLEEPLVADYFLYSSDGLGVYWSVSDLTGDGLPDLVQHAHGNNAAAETMGNAWYVWPNTGSAFGGRVTWTLPMDHRDLDGFHAANSVQTVLDINGDSFADLVIARDPDTGDVFGVDTAPYWQVFLGDGATGFATTPTEWFLPSGMVHPSEVYEGASHTVRDIDGDGAVEMVRIRNATGETFGWADGNPHWRIHESTGSGFDETHREWALPESRSESNPDYTEWVDDAYYWHTTLDVTGDGLADLVLPRSIYWPFHIYGDDPDWHWRVHENTGSGFSPTYVEWSLPDPLFAFPSSSADVVYPTSSEWRTFSIGGGDPVLVVTRDPETDEAFVEDGEAIWAIFDATGRGYEDIHSSWSLPDDVFDTFANGGGGAGEGWFTRDMDGDGCSDLVLTAGLGLGQPADGAGQWWVYRGI